MRKALYITGGIVLLTILTMCMGIDTPLTFVLLPVLWLAFGWIGYVGRTFPQVRINPDAVALGIVALIISAALLHTSAAWLWNALNPGRRWRTKWTAAILALIVVTFSAGICAVAITHQTLWLVRDPRPMFAQGSERGNRVKCASNLRQIGQGIAVYLNDHPGPHPDSFASLIKFADIHPEVFTCPSSNDDRATGNNLQEVLAEFQRPGHCSYIYTAAARPRNIPSDTVIAYESPGNHEEDGGNVLFADGHVEWFDAKVLASIISSAATRPAAP